MTNSLKMIAAVAAVVVVAGAIWLVMSGTAGEHPLSIARGDTVSSWSFQSSHADGGEMEKRARDEIARLEEMIGKDNGPDVTDYQLYVGIANQYQLLGDGQRAYEYLGKALAIDAEHTGLAWHNLGVLMERLGAKNTARVAYANAVEAQPHIDQYWVAHLRFLTNHFPAETNTIDRLFADAEAQFRNPASVLQVKAAWLEATDRKEEAAALWKRIEELSHEGAPGAVIL